MKSEEIATLIAGGRRFTDWETIWVQHRWAEAFPMFQFTASERDPLPDYWGRLQFKPGDSCAIYLGGVLAINGFILRRQTAYDANNHAVQMFGASRTWAAARASIIHKTGNFDDKTFEEVAREVIGPTGVGVRVIGKLDATPFVRLQNEPGESVWQFLERIARPRGVVMGSDHLGNFLLIGDHAYGSAQSLVEGHNIKSCQCIISIENTRSDFRVRGQTAGSDPKHGQEASEQEAGIPGSLKQYSPLLMSAEQPVWDIGEVAERAKNEAIWNEGTIVEATITVQGWFCSPGQLWRAGDKVTVKSPMAMLSQDLKIQTATFTQDGQSGTQTALELVAPWLLKDSYNYQVGNAVPAAPSGATSMMETPSATPASVTAPEPPMEILI